MPAKKTLLGNFAGFLIKSLDKRRLPQIDGEITLDGLNTEVEVIRDKWGIPHIYAENLEDAIFAQGFVHSQDRFFQMELNRRTGQGTLSQLFGEVALDTDRVIRTFGFNRLGREDWTNASDEFRSVVLAYNAGVNAYLSRYKRKLPIEFTLLSHHPDPWKPEDTFAFIRVMLWQLSHAWQGEIIRAEIAEKVGSEHAADLEINFSEGNYITLPKGIEYNKIDPAGKSFNNISPFLESGNGSNGWVIAPFRSETGSAVLCNDMHLSLTLPALWYQVDLNAGEDYHVTGASLPGIPMVMVGHNARIAWGMTLAMTDAEDLFIEQIDSQDRYLFQDDWHEVDIIQEVIEIKKKDVPHIEKVMITRHGPIISDVVGYQDQKITVNSMALRPCPAVEGWLKLNQAGNWDDFVKAMEYIEAPQLNVVYADVENNIGYWVTGKIPIRANGYGNIPVPGWSGEYEWVGEIPFEEMPHALNPDQGYLVTSNNKIIPDDYPYFLGNVWMNGFRAQRLDELIQSREILKLQDHQNFQMDFKCIPGLELVKRLSIVTDPDPDVQLALQLLDSWDGYLTVDSVGGTVYEVVRNNLVKNLLVPGLGEDLSIRFMGKGFHPLLSSLNEFYGNDTQVMLRLIDNPDNWWVKEAGGRDVVLSKSLKQTVSWLRENMGVDQEDWQWGKIHTVSLQHTLSIQKPLDQVFNIDPFPVGGDTDTAFQTAVHPETPYDNKDLSPTFRQVVDLGDLSNSFTIVPPGQSGQVTSAHYADLIEPWLVGESHPMLWTREQVEANSEGKIILKRVKSKKLR